MIRASVLFVCFVALACAPSAPEAEQLAVAKQQAALVTAFASGSLIIPMDTASQNNGTLRAFGLVDRLLRANVPVSRVALTGKAAGAIDFSATVNQQEGGAVLGLTNYRGGPFIIAAADATPAVVTLVNTYLASDTVTNVHVATAPFNADVQRTLVAAPRIAVLRDGNEGIAYGYLNAANITDSLGNAWTNVSPGALTLAAAAGVNGGAFDGALFNAGQPAFDQLTSMHYTPPANNEVVREVRGWLSLGPTTHAYMQCAAIDAFENNVNGHFLTDAGIVDDGAAANPARVLVPDNLFAQFDGAFTVDFGAVDSIGLNPGSGLYANSSVLMDRDLSTFSTRMIWLTGRIDGDLNKGKISYLAGHQYSTALPISTNPLTNGTRLFLDGLYETPGLFSVDQPAVTVTKSAPATTNTPNITFTINYANAGPGAAFGASLVDVVPAGTVFVSATGGGVNAAGTVTWNLGTLAKASAGSVTLTVSVAAEGTYTNRATISYTVGLTQKSISSNLTSTIVDRTVPNTTLTSMPPALSNSAAAAFTFTGTEPGTFECSLDGAAFSVCTTPQTLVGLADGSHTFQVRARDGALNVDATPASYTWTVDTTAPNTALTSTPPALTNSPAATFTFTGTEPGTFECSLDGAAFAVCTTPAALAGLADGSHTFQVRARDTAGNVDATPASFTWTVDTTAPDTAFTTTPPALSSSASAAFTFTGTEPGTFECSLDGAAFALCTTPAALASLADGSHTFRARARDAAGNVDATPASFTWTVDTTAPNTTLTSTPPALSNLNSAAFTFISTEPGTFECSLDGAVFTVCTTPVSLTGLADGSHTFQVRARDAAGNVDATPASFTWTVDTTPPDTTITSGPAALTNATAATITFTATEPGTFECALDGAAFSSCTTPLSLSALAEGSHTLLVRATDAAGNVDATPASRTWVIDLTPPDTTITSGPPALDLSTSATFTFTSSEPGATFQCALDGAAFVACASPATFTALAEGSHTLLVQAVDGAGNIDPTPASRTWTVDSVAPDTTLVSGPSGTVNSATASFVVTSEPGATFECALDGAVFAVCPASSTWPGLADGSHTLLIRAKDAAGNVDHTPASRTWTVDTTAPDTTITAGPTGSVSTTDAMFAFTSTRAQSTFECSLDGAAFSACNAPASLTGLTDGSHTFSVRATDSNGTVDPTPATRTWIVDTQAPDTRITVAPPALTNATSATFAFTSPEAGATFECSLDGAAWTTCTSPSTTTGTLTDGVHVLLVRARDAAGNIDPTPARATWQVDTIAPAAPIVTEPVADASTGGLPRFGGLAEPGSTVTVTINGMTVCTGIAAPDGRWSCNATTALTTGARSATATATDGAGNTSGPSLPRAFTVDTSKPDTVILTGPPALTNLARVAFTVAADTAGATFECSLDGAAFTACTATPAFVTLTDGAHHLEVRAVVNGVVDPTPATWDWTRDLTGPATPVLTSPTANAATSATPTFTGTAEPGSSVLVYVDGQPACTAVADVGGNFSCAAPSAFPPGPHTAHAIATDPAGNASTPSTDVPFSVGTTTLDTAIIDGPSGTVSSTSANFAFTSTVIGATFECSLDGATFAACPTPVTFSGLAPGSHTLEVRAVDGANVDTTPASRTWTIDSSAPTTPTVVTPADQATVGTRTPRYSGTATPGSTVIVSVDDREACRAIADSSGAWACSSAFPLADGPHRVAAVARDAAGNISPPSMTNRFTVALPAVTVAITSPADGTITNDSTPELRGTASPGSVVSVFVDGVLIGTTTANASGAWTLTPTTPLSDGLHALTASAELGGVTSPLSPVVRVTIDTRAPVVTLALTQDNSQTAPGVTFSADETPVTFTCSLDGAAFAPCTSPLDVSSATEGNHTLVVRATDAAGNTGEATGTFVITRPIVASPAIGVRGGGCGCGSTDGMTSVLAMLGLLLFATRRSRRGLPAVVALIVTSHVASAQVAGFDIERLDLNPGASASLVNGTGDVMRKGSWRASLLVHYEHDPLVLYRLDTNERLGAVIGSRLSAHLTGAWAPLDWIEVGIQLPIVLWQGGNDLSAWNIAKPATTAVGTPWLTGRFAFLREHAGAPLDLALQVGLGLPFGTAAAFSNTTPIAFAPRLGAGKSLTTWLRLGAEVGFLVRGAPAITEAVAQTGSASAFTFGLSATTKGEGLRGELTFRAAVALDHALLGGEVLLGARYPLGKWVEVFALGGPGLGTLPGNPAFRVLAGVAIQPPVEAEPAKVVLPPAQRCDDSVSIEELRQKCGALDADGDGILNANDSCARVAGVAAAQGCPLPDTDADGLTDDVDACPKEAGPRERNGCPLHDQDKDGVEDANDACPTEAGPVERKGCPLKDQDGDTIEDAVDACPTEAGPVERKGCPMRDQDGDTVEDALDNCPTVAGTPENAGCPAKQRQLVIITADRLVIHEAVYFATGKAMVLPRSDKLLDNVAEVLIAHPEVPLVRIEGHTDSSGVREKNVTLSQARADAVKAQLVKRKVPAERLHAVGFGPDQPTAPNDTPAGREKNRRVEFNFETAPK